MKILALDLATNAGWALGSPGEMPKSGSVRLRKTTQPWLASGYGLLRFLDDTFLKFDFARPDIIVAEAPIPPGASKGAVAAVHQGGLAMLTDALAQYYGIRIELADVGDVTRHFTGKYRWGGRDERKLKIIERARLLKYVEPTCKDDNRCDALAVWDYACAKYAGYRPRELVMFGQVPA